MDAPVNFFIDERESQFFELKALDFDQIGYVKILESDFVSTKKPNARLVVDPTPRINPVDDKVPLPGVKTAGVEDIDERMYLHEERAGLAHKEGWDE